MATIRLLQDVVGSGPVQGATGDILEVDHATAAVWADGIRAERVVTREVPVETAVDRGAPGRTRPATKSQ